MVSADVPPERKSERGHVRQNHPFTKPPFYLPVKKILSWAAANGGVTNGGLRGVWPPLPEIGRNRPFSPFFCLFCPFPEGLKSTWKIQKTEEKGLFPQISSDFLKPPSLKPPFAAPQLRALRSQRFRDAKLRCAQIPLEEAHQENDTKQAPMRHGG